MYCDCFFQSVYGEEIPPSTFSFHVKINISTFCRIFSARLNGLNRKGEKLFVLAAYGSMKGYHVIYCTSVIAAFFLLNIFSIIQYHHNRLMSFKAERLNKNSHS